MKIYIAITGCIAFILTLWGGLLVALPFSLICFVISVVLAVFLNEKAKAAKLQEYAEQIDNIYICSLWEDDDTVMARAQDAEAMLVKSGNQQNVKVHKIYFRYGEHINESWEDYQARVKAFIQADRAERHKELAAKGGVNYEKFWLGQRKSMEA